MLFGGEAFGRCLGHQASLVVHSDGKESTFIEGDLGSIPELVRSPGEENDYPLQHSCLENSKDRAWGLQSMGSQRVRHE